MKKIICLIIFCCICISPAYARWATFDDAPMKFSYVQEINIDKSGKKEFIIEMSGEILKEQGRSYFAHYNLIYNGVNARIKILEAKTSYKGKEYKVGKKSIEDKPLASPAHGFDQNRQILLAFPKSEIGAKIYLKYKYTEKRPVLENFYSGLFTFGAGEFVEKERVILRSKIPLHIKINDPEKVLKIKKDKHDKFHNLDIVLTKPLYTDVIGEPGRNILNKKLLTYISLSSFNKWNALASRIDIEGYAEIFKESLPKTFVQIANIAAQKKNEEEQINTVTSLLNEKIQYMGDWRSIKGKFFPRSLKQIDKTRLGDCKDFSASTAVLLSKLGYKAQIALVRRGVGSYFFPNTLPVMSAFNHAIVKITDKHGKVRWIDPTNFVSMSSGIFPDIAGKMALVLDDKQPSYERIPDVDPNHAQIIMDSKKNILNNGTVIVSGTQMRKNEFAISLTGAELTSTKKTIKDDLFYYLSGEDLEKKNKISMMLPDLKSRTVKDILIEYSYKQENELLKTNLGYGISSSYRFLDSFLNTPEYYVSDILISSFPYSVKSKSIIQNVKVKNIKSLNKEIKSPWVYISRKFKVNGQDLEVKSEIIIYKNLILNEDLRKPEFIKLKKELEENFKDVAIIFSK
jgi:hypothetical protein